MSALFSPLRLRNLTLANRIVVSPLWRHTAWDGKATDCHYVHWDSLAQSGAGLLRFGATAAEPDGRIMPGDLGLSDDRTEAAPQPVLEATRRHSPEKVAIQLAASRRKASTREGHSPISVEDGGWRTVGPSSVLHKEDEGAPASLDDAGLGAIRQALEHATRRTKRLGVGAIEIHDAHGCLLHESLFSDSNRRPDASGESLRRSTSMISVRT